MVRAFRGASVSSRQPELAQLLAQRAPVDSEDRGGAALVARRVIEHGAEQRLFDFAKHEVVEVSRLMTVQVRELIRESTLRVITQRDFERAIATGVFSCP